MKIASVNAPQTNPDNSELTWFDCSSKFPQCAELSLYFLVSTCDLIIGTPHVKSPLMHTAASYKNIASCCKTDASTLALRPYNTFTSIPTLVSVSVTTSSNPHVHSTYRSSCPATLLKITQLYSISISCKVCFFVVNILSMSGGFHSLLPVPATRTSLGVVHL